MKNIYEIIKNFNWKISKTENNICKIIWNLSYSKEDSNRLYLLNFNEFYKTIKDDILEIEEYIFAIKWSMKAKPSMMKQINNFEFTINKYLWMKKN